MVDYTSSGYEFFPDVDGGICIVPPEGHKGVIELTEEDLTFMLSELRSQQSKEG